MIDRLIELFLHLSSFNHSKINKSLIEKHGYLIGVIIYKIGAIPYYKNTKKAAFLSPVSKKSFGQKRGKQWWPGALEGHSNFRLKRGQERQQGAKGCSRGFPSLCTGPARKEASLLTSLLVTLWLQSN